MITFFLSFSGNELETKSADTGSDAYWSTPTTWLIKRSSFRSVQWKHLQKTSSEQISSNDRYTTLLLEVEGERERERKRAIKHVLKTRKSRLTLSNHTGFSVNNFVFVRLKPNQRFYSKTHRSKSVLESSAIFKMVSHVQIGRFWCCCHTSSTGWQSYKCWWRRTCWQSYKSCKFH